MYVVTDVRALNPEDDVFGNVGSMVGHSFQIAGHEQRIESLPHDFRVVVHSFDELDESIVTHAVDDAVHFEDGLCQLGFTLNE